MKKILATLVISLSTCNAFSQSVSGTSLSITNPATGNIVQTQTNSGGVTTTNSIVTDTTQSSMNANTQSGGAYTSSTWISTVSSGPNAGINAGSSNQISLYSGNLTGVGGNIDGTSILQLNPTQATLVSTGASSYSAMAWGATAGTYTNGIQADSNGVNIASATAISLNGVTNSITGTTNINTTGNANSNMGSSGTGSVTLQSGTNSFVVSNSGSTITGSATVAGNTNLNGATNNIGTSQASVNNIGTFAGSTNTIGGATSTNTILGTTNINTTGSANTAIGNNSGTVSVSGSAVTVGANSGSSVTVGNSSGNSTISMNNNRIQNVANGTSANDAVNFTQLSTVANNVTTVSNNVTSLSNSVNTLTNNFNNLNNQVQQNQSEYRNGIAGVAAMNGIGSLNAGQKVNFGVGVGSFGGQAGVAVGGNVRVTDSVSLKAAVATASSNTSSSVGLTIGF